jgi:DNA-binding HxlR family transcriptional regulator
VPTDPDIFLAYPGSAVVVMLLANKWTIPAIHELARGSKRTGELKRALVGVSQKMLTQTLRTLEGHGLVERTVHAGVPPRVDYRLTDLGHSLNEPLGVLCRWTKRHGRALERSIARRLSKRRPVR